jgi:hypothetical protein
LVAHNVGGMASKGLRAISCQVIRKIEAGYNSSHTSETLIGYTACCAVVHYLNFAIKIPIIARGRKITNIPRKIFNILFNIENLCKTETPITNRIQ